MIESIKDNDIEYAAAMPSLNEAMLHLLQIAGIEPDSVFHDDLWYSYDGDKRTRELLQWLKTEA